MGTRKRVLAVLAIEGAPIGMTELCKAIGRPRSEVRDVVRALVRERVVTRKPGVSDKGHPRDTINRIPKVA